MNQSRVGRAQVDGVPAPVAISVAVERGNSTSVQGSTGILHYYKFYYKLYILIVVFLNYSKNIIIVF